MFPNKQTTRAACVARYGAIDFVSGHWGRQHEWMTTIEINPADFPNWVVDAHGHPHVASIYCNKDMAGPLVAALKSVHDKGLGNVLKLYDGCFNIRKVRGSTAFSAHAYGLAIDLNADDNNLGATHGGFYNNPEFVKCFTDQGFAWGGNFHGRKDPMHFSYCFEG